jgi:hypothetical protein
VVFGRRVDCLQELLKNHTDVLVPLLYYNQYVTPNLKRFVVGTETEASPSLLFSF